MYTVGILTISDKGAAGKREDAGGLLLHQLVEPLPGKVVVYQVVPDEEGEIRNRLISYCDEWKVDLALTTGGTGVSLRDVTPEATLAVIERLIPGIGEIMRMEGYRKNPRSIISRGVGGVRKRTLIVNFPGSPRAVRESFEILFPALAHAIDKIGGAEEECGAP